MIFQHVIGQQETPVISVSSSGLITATAGHPTAHDPGSADHHARNRKQDHCLRAVSHWHTDHQGGCKPCGIQHQERSEYLWGGRELSGERTELLVRCGIYRKYCPDARCFSVYSYDGRGGIWAYCSCHENRVAILELVYSPSSFPPLCGHDGRHQ